MFLCADDLGEILGGSLGAVSAVVAVVLVVIIVVLVSLKYRRWKKGKYGKIACALTQCLLINSYYDNIDLCTRRS